MKLLWSYGAQVYSYEYVKQQVEYYISQLDAKARTRSQGCCSASVMEMRSLGFGSSRRVSRCCASAEMFFQMPVRSCT